LRASAVRESWKTLEARVEASRGSVEAAAARALRAGDAAAASEILTAFMDQTWRDAIAQARDLASQLD
jgi:hypothetical protein